VMPKSYKKESNGEWFYAIPLNTTNFEKGWI
jgi:hypothetical protein